jgi:predicted phosphohydrolase
MSKLFAIGDLHLAFSSDKPMDVFGTVWEDHHLKLEAAWRDTVSEEDTVFIVGDISWALKMEDAMVDLVWIHELPGTKILLRGNHDYWWHGVSRMRELWPDDMLFVQNDALLMPGSNGEIAICGSRAWLTPEDKLYKETDDRKYYDRELARLRLALESASKLGASEIVVGLHYPPSGGKHKSGFIDLIEEFGVRTVVYGHLHGHEAYKKGIKGLIGYTEYHLVSADYLDFKPSLISATKTTE